MNNQLSTTNRVALVLDWGNPFFKWVNNIGVFLLFLLAGLIFVDVFMRYVFNNPIPGAQEMTGVLMMMVVFLGIAATQRRKGHVSIDLVIAKLPSRARLVMEGINNLISIALFAILIWRSIVYIQSLIHTHLLIRMINIPLWPFVTIIPFGCALILIVLLRDFCTNLTDGQKLQLRVYQWLLMCAIPVAIAILAIFWMQPNLWHVNLSVVGVIGVVLSVLFFLTGMPISFVMIMIGLLFMGHIRGVSSGLTVVGIDLYQTPADSTWATVAFFTLMGYFCLFARLGVDLYYAAYKWLGKLFGGLAIATIGGCTAFGAIVGDMIASTVTFTAVSLPEMRKYSYSETLATGTICAGATLGPLIPPSVTFIVYGALTGVSIGKLFIAGIFPGLLLALCFMTFIYIRCRINPQLGPPGPDFTFKEKVVSLKAGGPIALLFILVIGGIYTGIFTATEGGGIGAIGAFIIGLLMKRFNRQNFKESLLSAGNVTGMVFLILIGANIFTRFLVSCNLASSVGNFFNGLEIPHILVLLLILVIYIVLGCFMDSLPLMLIGVPLFHPIIVAMGYSPIWFAVILAMVVHMGMITPPVGAILFALKGVEKNMPIATIYKGVMPFIGVTLIAVIIVIACPSIATWLPNVFK